MRYNLKEINYYRKATLSSKKVTAYSTLVDAHKITVDWLKFAEAKLLGLAGINLLFLFGIHRLTIESPIWDLYKSLATVCLLLSVSICFLAIQPKIGRPAEKDADIEHHESNDLLFYGDIAKYPKKQYQLLIKKKLAEIDQLNDIDEWYTGQIWSISRITMQKLAFFNTATWFFLIAAISPIGAYALYLFKDSVAGRFE